jgi:DNA-binding transcriptional ArsR family regulator
MDMETAVRALGALAQGRRLEAFKLLVRAGKRGMPAGEIARELGMLPNTLSSHLAILSQGGLVASRREGRSIIYFLDLGGTRQLLSFLMEDCCQGRPEVCEPLLSALLSDSCRLPAHPAAAGRN